MLVWIITLFDKKPEPITKISCSRGRLIYIIGSVATLLTGEGGVRVLRISTAKGHPATPAEDPCYYNFSFFWGGGAGGVHLCLAGSRPGLP